MNNPPNYFVAPLVAVAIALASFGSTPKILATEVSPSSPAVENSPSAQPQSVASDDRPQTPPPTQASPQIPSQETPQAQPPSPDDLENKPLGLPRGSSTDWTGDQAASQGQSPWVMRTLTALGSVVGLVFLAKAGLARWGGTSSRVAGFSAAVEVLQRVAVGGRHRIALVRVGGRILVLADGSNGLHALADISDPEEVAALLAAVSAAKPGSHTHGFAQLISRFNGDYHEDQDWKETGTDNAEHRVDRARDQISGLASRLRALGSSGVRG